MACFYPLPATPRAGLPPLIHSRINYKRRPGDIQLPCSNCIGCKLDRSKQWTIRLVHEAQLHKANSFITLTYNDETLRARRPDGGTYGPPCPPPLVDASEDIAPSNYIGSPRLPNVDSLRPRDVQLFMKKLRKELTTRDPSTRVRYYLVGEYGERFQRPHYHIALFGEDFSDDRIYWRTSGGHKCYRSSRLESLWTHGNSEIGDLTIDSAAYVASYVLKKVNGKMAEEHYRRETENGPIWLVPEFALMSRGGRTGHGIAHDWITNYNNQVYPHDYVEHKGGRSKPPRYYDKITELLHPKVLTTLRTQRAKRALELAGDNTPARLHDKEVVLKAKLRTKIRQLEN